MKIINFCLMGLVLLDLIGCATIPPEAPQLSLELGKRINVIEDANITLLNRFFDQKRKEIDKFIENEWVPTFAEEFFKIPQIAQTWDTVVRENDKNERLKFIVMLGPKLQEKINQKRLELIKPLDDLERSIERKIRDEYTQARAMNNSITSFLFSASKVAENRNRYLEMAGVTEDRIGEIIDQTDEAVSGLLIKAKDSQDKVNKTREYIDKIRSLKDSLFKKEE